MKIPNLSPTQSIIIGLFLRLSLIGYAEIQDKYFNLKYTDIDYSVYTDGANYVLDGGTPYDRHTYRYTPILAYLMTGNILLFQSFGKVLFSVIDIATVYIINQIILMTSKQMNDQTRAFLLSIWLFNPLTIQVSTRGNADTLVVMLVYITLYFLIKKQYKLGALTYGFVVHFKIYPIIYCLPIYFYIDNQRLKDETKYSILQNILILIKLTKNQFKNKILSHSIIAFKKLFTRNRIIFASLSAGIFMILTVIFHLIYPDQFIYQTYLYHLIRKDNRHNFSPYFYFIYLYFDSMTPTQSILAFLPQFTLIVTAGFGYFKDLPFCMLIQTMVFVAFNKVCTAQYFVWWIALLPLALVNSRLKDVKRTNLIFLGIFWFILEVQWNIGAYLLEIRGMSVFSIIFISCLLFFMANIYFIYVLIINHQPKYFEPMPIEKQY